MQVLHSRMLISHIDETILNCLISRCMIQCNQNFNLMQQQIQHIILVHHMNITCIDIFDHMITMNSIRLMHSTFIYNYHCWPQLLNGYNSIQLH